MEIVEIPCRCKDCIHSEKITNNENLLHCYYWDYESGFEPNITCILDFCSNATPKGQ